MSTGFNPRPREGGDPTLEARADATFQSTPPRGGRPSIRPDWAALGFNPRPREGGDLPPSASRYTTCFNPRPREGGDAADQGFARGAAVSIHAPARGATAAARGPGDVPCVSIHAPARGATTRRRRS